MVLMGCLATSVAAFIFRTVESRDRLSRSADAIIGASILLESVETDLLTCIAGQGETGVLGTTDTLLVRARSVTLTPVAGQPADLQGSEYRFASGAVEGRRWAGETASGTFEPIVTGVGRLRFRYHNGKEWRESFDSGRVGTLPAAIEVAVWFAGPASEAVVSETESGRDSDEPPRSPPDRLRIITIPDGPASGGKGLP